MTSEGGSEIARAIRAELLQMNVRTFLDVDDLGSNYDDERLLREIESAPYNCVEYSHTYFAATIKKTFDFLVSG